ncbi:hypothetical protein PpBr36_04245 [Pyricularia pennisetigena]|uniref:hypothetical protein n=1 Tax=Pyricularia pennisetigena TaxID=1578925 RepID=UPI001152E12C|nr:hypothetical protein PpBr36_04245 [Pyricularia pennisetigena]TLS27379.1 hypothetical protein PpBr36_04245 [Pyricularia pennisetigena]
MPSLNFGLKFCLGSGCLAALVVRSLAFPNWSAANTSIVALVFASSLAVIWRLILYPKFFSPFRDLPSPPGGTFLNGQTWKILEQGSSVPLEEWGNTIENDGMIRVNVALNSERLLVTSIEGIADVLVRNADNWRKPEALRHSLASVIGDGLIVSEGNAHKVQRRNLVTAFTGPRVKALYPQFWTRAYDGAEEIAQEMKKANASDGHVADVAFTDWLRRITLDNIGEAGFGFSFNAIQNPKTEVNLTYEFLFKSQETHVAVTFLEALADFLPVLWLQKLPIQHNIRTKAAVDTIRSIIRGVIQAKRTPEDDPSAAVDLISVAKSSGAFDDESLVDQSMTFLVAGHETVAGSLGWGLVELCRRPEMQARLRDEVRSGLPSPADPSARVSERDFQALPYLQAFCSEVLRFYPSVPATRREAISDTMLLGRAIPKGTQLLISPAATNRSRELWGDDAGQFKPERWLAPGQTNKGGANSNYANLTFLHGPRSCIGASFARAEFLCIIAVIVGRFELSFADPDKRVQVLNSGFTERPAGDLLLRTKLVHGAW